jgi:DNA-binding transcriptional LysR family regulator
MRLEKLRQVDLNLLIIFAVIAEEKSATKASARLLLSQPAVSRALQRARSMFQDELVIRSSSGFELTLRGRKILQELEQLLPKIEGLVVPSIFDPKRERSNFRISGPDNVCIALLPHLCRRYTTERYKVNLTSCSTLTTACCPLTSVRRDFTARTGSVPLPARASLAIA